jgi:hypothetical protein
LQNLAPLAAPWFAWAIGPDQSHFRHTSSIPRRYLAIHTEQDTYIDRFMNRELISKQKDCDGRADLCVKGVRGWLYEQWGGGFMGSRWYLEERIDRWSYVTRRVDILTTAH